MQFDVAKLLKSFLLWLGVMRRELFPETEPQIPIPPMLAPFDFVVKDPSECPDVNAPTISPDGKYLAYSPMYPDPNPGSIQIIEIDNRMANPDPITQTRRQLVAGPVMDFDWLWDSKTIIYSSYDEETQQVSMVAINVMTEAKKVLSQGAAPLELMATSRKRPDHVVVGVPKTTSYFFKDFYLMNVRTGVQTLLYQNDRFAVAYFDHDLQFKVGIPMADPKDPNPDFTIFANKSGNMVPFYSIPDIVDTYYTKPICPCFLKAKCDLPSSPFDLSGTKLYWASTVGRNTAALVEMDFDTAATKVIYGSQKADIADVVMDPRTETPALVATEFGRQDLIALDRSLAADINVLQKVSPGDIKVVHKSADFQRWVVKFVNDDYPLKFYLYDRGLKKAKFLFDYVVSDSLRNQPLAKTYIREVKSSNNLTEVCYITLPVESDTSKTGIPNKPLPMVFYVHAGPWKDRMFWHYEQPKQLFANRGYAFMTCNYRSSGGYGKDYVEAGTKAKLLIGAGDDIKYAVEEAIRVGIADKTRIAIMGGSYGGFWTVASLVYWPDMFQCGVAKYPPVDIADPIINRPPAEQAGVFYLLNHWDLNVKDPNDQKLLQERSALTHIDKLKAPIMVSHGGADDNVLPVHSERLAAAMKKINKPLTYLVFPEEGHGFTNFLDQMAHQGVAEQFLKRCVGGRAQPFENPLEGLNVVVKDAGIVEELKPYVEGA